MNAQMVLTMGQEALLMLLMVSAPVLGVVLLVGLVISLFQAVTQINEATLAFVPKLVAAIAVFALAGPWMLTMLVESSETGAIWSGVSVQPSSPKPRAWIPLLRRRSWPGCRL